MSGDPSPHVPASMPHLQVGGRPLPPSPAVTVALSKGRSLRCRIEGAEWVVEVQRHRQGAKKGGQWYEGRKVILSLAIKEACGDALSDGEQAEIGRYLTEEFYRLTVKR